MRRTDFFEEIDFYINKTLHWHWRVGKYLQLSYASEENFWLIMV